MVPQILCAHCHPDLSDNRFNPRKIPAKVALEGLGEMEYSASRLDTFGGGSTRILPNDPNRTMSFVPAPDGRAAREALNQRNINGVSRNLAYGCVLATVFGSVLFTAGVFTGNVLAIGAGLGIVMAASFVLMDSRAPQPATQLNGAPQVQLCGTLRHGRQHHTDRRDRCSPSRPGDPGGAHGSHDAQTD